MLFNSYVFILLFLPMAVGGYFAFERIANHRTAKIFLFMMSLWFYGYYSIPYLILFVLSLLVNYLLVYKMGQDRHRTAIFRVGIGFNLGLLFVFKYYDFFVENINYVFKTDWVLLHLILPLGISFFTFQQLSYLIDVYRKEAKVYSFLDFAVYITFFPQLVAGPIVLHDEFIPQINREDNWCIKTENFEKGLMSFTVGLAKKVLIADLIGNMVNWSYANVAELSGLEVVITMLAYTLQIYFDFSGYSDMASGIARMFNIILPMNFDSPYKADNIIEFWKRWHMTLTRFFSKYVYIPLGGNRGGEARTYFNIFIVFLVSGLWHGANWTFIIWGICHGIANIFCRFGWGYIKRIPSIIRWVVNFIFLNMTWMLFRAESVGQAILMIKQIFQKKFWKLSELMVTESGQLEYKIVYKVVHLFTDSMSVVVGAYIVLLLGIALMIALKAENVQRRLDNYRMTCVQAFGLATLLSYCVLSLTSQSNFLYFNF